MSKLGDFSLEKNNVWHAIGENAYSSLCTLPRCILVFPFIGRAASVKDLIFVADMRKKLFMFNGLKEISQIALPDLPLSLDKCTLKENQQYYNLAVCYACNIQIYHVLERKVGERFVPEIQSVLKIEFSNNHRDMKYLEEECTIWASVASEKGKVEMIKERLRKLVVEKAKERNTGEHTIEAELTSSSQYALLSRDNESVNLFLNHISNKKYDSAKIREELNPCPELISAGSVLKGLGNIVMDASSLTLANYRSPNQIAHSSCCAFSVCGSVSHGFEVALANRRGQIFRVTDRSLKVRELEEPLTQVQSLIVDILLNERDKCIFVCCKDKTALCVSYSGAHLWSATLESSIKGLSPLYFNEKQSFAVGASGDGHLFTLGLKGVVDIAHCCSSISSCKSGIFGRDQSM
eukprot:Nk52_evm7s343 gene=Nk52_evmTU7s343